MADIESCLLADLSELQTIADSVEYAATRSLQHKQLVGVIKSLLAAGLIAGEVVFMIAYLRAASMPLCSLSCD